MHIFSDITSLSELEENKAINRCMGAIFSSISHELRSPINAFSNSISLIHQNIDELMKIMSEDPSLSQISKKK